jgi:hypothetical protein
MEPQSWRSGNPDRWEEVSLHMLPKTVTNEKVGYHAQFEKIYTGLFT